MTEKQYPHGRRGFASMSPDRQREIASKAGIASQASGHGHSWAKDRKGASAAGAIGGTISRGGRGRRVEQ